jgi:tRNA pseudouridine38-40 synthase
MRNIKFTLAYDGTEFSGWQSQPGQTTVQGTLSDVLEKLTRSRLMIQGAGRTDAGVHAVGQVANFKTDARLTAEEFQRACNALLPRSIRIVAASEVAFDFHARWNAVAKTYRYTIYRGRVVPPFLWRYVQHEPYPLDFAAMAEAARKFEGEHDFTSFAASTGTEEGDRDRKTVRLIHSSAMQQSGIGDRHPCGETWVYAVRGKSFLRYMVRKMVGTIVDVGRGKLTPDDIPKLMELRDRSRSGPTVSPQGLCLCEIEYPPEDASMFVTHEL